MSIINDEIKRPSRPFVRCDEVKSGDILVADGGFTCIHEGRKCLVKLDNEDESLYVDCCGERPDFRSGKIGGSNYQDRHYLDGQVENGHYIGFRRPE